jgi:hypothetical protein
MKKNFFTLFSLFLLFASVSLAQTARIQVIHNSADAAAQQVDVYLDGTLLLDNFAFRTATPFVNAPAGVEIDLDIAPATSASVAESIFNKKVTLTENQTYVIVASGIVSATGYTPATDFDLYVYAMGRETASGASNTDVLVFHGSTDAPVVDVVEPNAQLRLVDNLAFGSFAGYLELPTANYSLQIQNDLGNVAVAQFAAPLATLALQNTPLVVVASGFLNPANNSNGPAFGLYVALPAGGALVELPAQAISTARIQVIHNSADLAAPMVDVYLNDDLLLDNFAFRTATPFVDVQAGVDFVVSIAPSTSTSVADAIADFNYNLPANGKFILVANGIVSAEGYSPSIDFDIYAFGSAREVGTNASSTDVLVFHGSTDAPEVTVFEIGAGAGELFTFEYGEFAGYLELPTADYVLDIRAGGESVIAYSAPLATLGLEGAALTVLASGFLNPANNSDGPAFGLFVALADGGALIPLPVYEMPEPMARLQVIHNSTALELVDVFVNGDLFLEEFAFRTATPFVDVPAGVDLDIRVAPAGEGIGASVGPFTFNLTDGEKYILVANGLLAKDVAFNLYPFAGAREMATNASNTDVLVFHGSTDAPEVTVFEIGAGAGELFTFEYGDFAGYLELPTADYVLDIRAGGESVIAYSAPLSTLGLDGAALTVLASGYLNPEFTPGFGLFVALADGGALIPLPVYEMPEPMARLQVIHNSTALELVDVFVNGDLFLEDFAFRTATPFVDVPAGVDLDIRVAAAGEGIGASVGPFTFNLTDGEKYILVANGIFTKDYPFQFNLYPFAGAREMATNASNTDVLVFHGSTDAPEVTVFEIGAGAGELFTFEYGDFAGYLELPTADYVLDIRAGGESVIAYSAPLATLGLDGAALTVLASGYLNPEFTPGFGLFVALADGGALIPLPVYEIPEPMARLQVIHNSTALELVDVFVNGDLFLEDFAFRTATPFVDVPAGVDLDIRIAAAGEGIGASVGPFTFNLTDGEKYILVANGIFTKDYPFQFNLYPFAGAREMATNASNTDVLVFHGSQNAPVVDVYESSVPAGTVVDNLAYGEFAGYLELPTADYILNVQDETGAVTVASYSAPLATLELDGQALVVVASGLLGDGADPAFGLYVALASGGDLIALPVYTTSAPIVTDNSVNISVYPNPVSSRLNIEFDVTREANITVEIYSIIGSRIATIYNERNAMGYKSVSYDVSNLPSGIYLVTVTNGQTRTTKKIQVSK